MTPEQALSILYQAARRAPMTADDHDFCRQAVELLAKVLQLQNKSVDESVETML